MLKNKNPDCKAGIKVNRNAARNYALTHKKKQHCREN